MTSKALHGGSEYYLFHVSSQDGKAESIALSLYEAFRSTELVKNLEIIGFDGTAVMTGHSGAVIRILEKRLGRPLQWSKCLLVMSFSCAMFFGY